jgi:hypothetical protein
MLSQAVLLSVEGAALPVEKLVQAAVGYRCMDRAMHHSQSHLWRSLDRLDNPEFGDERMRLAHLGDNKDTLSP